MGFLDLINLRYILCVCEVLENTNIKQEVAGTKAHNNAREIVELIYAGAAFCVIFFFLLLIDLWRGQTTLEQCKTFSRPRYLLKYAVVGTCNGLNGFFLVFAASVTAPFLQAILGTFQIFWTILFRFIILRKLPNVRQTLYAVGVFCGLFLASVPSVFGLDISNSFKTSATGMSSFTNYLSYTVRVLLGGNLAFLRVRERERSNKQNLKNK
ncbi:hypothetical protein RFI_24920 [Reticulomyxa filosa]|uniref:Uncharacterized protein n=1 Tax=Reticulomyxa filosa TaxID=46433 RepID=X6MHC4_RETFI|nr:hypothetical protein RFI_24920 [Reticulomyxa filosa]|eukprot:ETO12455.1 hypothetical protein RFI_24920 [Reticulomyxa filosa]